jgi:hypothetical protein
MQRTIGRPIWKIETRDTRDADWHPLRGYATRYQYVAREDAERMLATLQRYQPHAQFRIAPL